MNHSSCIFCDENVTTTNDDVLDGVTSVVSSSSSSSSTLDILAAIFFVIAAVWLVVALLYAALAVVFLRLRARGQLDRVYEQDFGTVRLGCLTLPCGWLVRRYVQHVVQRNSSSSSGGGPVNLVRFMTREERRKAMELLLTSSSKAEAFQEDVAPEQQQQQQEEEDDVSITSGAYPVCSICLGEYGSDQDVLQSDSCSHRFHKNCILDWLQRQEAKAECPCCRVGMVSEEDVWKTVKTLRQQQKRSWRMRGRREGYQENAVSTTALPPQSQTSSSSSSASSSDAAEGNEEPPV